MAAPRPPRERRWHATGPRREVIRSTPASRTTRRVTVPASVLTTPASGGMGLGEVSAPQRPGDEDLCDGWCRRQPGLGEPLGTSPTVRCGSAHQVLDHVGGAQMHIDPALPLLAVFG